MPSNDTYSSITHHVIQILALSLLLVLGADLLVKHLRTLLQSVRLLYRDIKEKHKTEPNILQPPESSV